jgi:hypothetical protein
MATTTNYGWTTPNDTDLVKDGAAAIRTLGSSVDTTTKALNPSTTLGDIEYRSATANTNTRLGIGTTGQVLTVAGGVPTWATSDDANAIQNALLTTTGDTIYASGTSTPARLGIGSTGNVLTVSGGVPTWAAPAGGGGMTLLSTTTLSGATTTISVASGYNTIVGVVFGCTNNSGFGNFNLAPNGTTNLSYGAAVARYPSTSYLQGFSAGYWELSAGYSMSHTSANNSFQFQIDNYTSASAYKNISSSGVYTNNDSQLQAVNIAGGFASNTAITSLVFSNSGGNHSAGTVLLYGVK